MVEKNSFLFRKKSILRSIFLKIVGKRAFKVEKIKNTFD